jgi:hypothetical protein
LLVLVVAQVVGEEGGAQSLLFAVSLQAPGWAALGVRGGVGVEGGRGGWMRGTALYLRNALALASLPRGLLPLVLLLPSLHLLLKHLLPPSLPLLLPLLLL